MLFLAVLLLVPFSAFVDVATPISSASIDSRESLSFEETCQLQNVSVINEFESINKMKDLDVNTLRSYGFTSKEIKTIKDDAFREYIAKLKNQTTDQELLDRGLSQEEVKTLRSSDSLGENALTTKILQRASSNLAISIVPQYVDQNKVNYMIYWHWDNAPIFRFFRWRFYCLEWCND